MSTQTHTPKPGMMFNHSKFLNPDRTGEPLRCKVTRIAQGVVYYRPHYGKHDDGSEWLGAVSYLPVSQFGTICAGLIP